MRKNKEGDGMSYSGWLIKVHGANGNNDYTIPAGKYIKADSYSAYRSIQDLDSYSDCNGVLHRTALDHVPCKIEFETPAMLTNTQYANFMSNIRKNYTVAKERKSLVSAYIPETDSYVTQEMYMPDITPEIYTVSGGVIRYNAIRIAFIGY